MAEFNIALIGIEGVGKTTFMEKLIKNSFNPNYNETYDDVLIHEYTMMITDDHTHDIASVKFRVHDACCAGDMFTNFDGAIIMFDLTNKVSFDVLEFYFEELYECNLPNMPIVLVGAKCDLESKGKLSAETINSELSKLREIYQFNYYEVSIKDNINVDEPFMYLIRDIAETQNISKVC